MKIFISWSGPHAMAIAKVLKAWLKNTFDSADPWVSDEDISGGQVSLAEIDRALDGAQFGIVVTTKANQDAPWLSYEAGAMSREVDGGETRVMPMLVDLRVTDLTSPLKQYQAARFDTEGIAKMIKSIGEVIGLDKEQIDNKIATRAGDLEQLVGQIPVPTPATPTKPTRPEVDVLEEIVTDLRALRTDFEQFRTALSAPPTRAETARRAIGINATMPRLSSGGAGGTTWDVIAMDVIDDANRKYFRGEPLIRYCGSPGNEVLIAVPPGTSDGKASAIARHIQTRVPIGMKVLYNYDSPAAREVAINGRGAKVDFPDNWREPLPAPRSPEDAAPSPG